jgi:CBS domain-containing protein
MGKNVRDLMTPKPGTVEPLTPIIEAAKIMQREDAGSVPVVEGDRLSGIVTDRDIVLRIVAEGRDPRSITVGEIASKQLVTIDPEQSVDEARRLMAEHQVRRLPVCEEDGRLVGIVAQADIAEDDPKKAGRMVEEISR